MSVTKPPTNQHINVLVLREFVSILEINPSFTIAQHFTCILRKRKSSTPVYEWSNEEFLNRLQQYKKELKEDSND